MKQLAGTIGKILFWVFAVLVFFWTASLSLAALRTILPGDPIKPYIGLVLTDIGALTWLLVFIGQAQGLPQRAVSLIMFIVDLAGVVLLSAFELLSSGQTLARIPPEMGNAVIWGVIGLTLINLAAAYFYHLAHPQTWKTIEFGVLTDRLQKEALDQAQAAVEKEAQQLGAILAARATADLKYQLRLPMSDFEAAEHARSDIPTPVVIDAQATDPEPVENHTLFSRLFKQPVPSPVAAGNQAPADVLGNHGADHMRENMKEPTQYERPHYDPNKGAAPKQMAYLSVSKHHTDPEETWIEDTDWYLVPREKVHTARDMLFRANVYPDSDQYKYHIAWFTQEEVERWRKQDGRPFPTVKAFPFPLDGFKDSWQMSDTKLISWRPPTTPRQQPRPQKFCYHCNTNTVMDYNKCSVCHNPYSYRPPETYRYTTLAEMLKWWQETTGWTVQYAVEKMYQDTHGTNNPDEVYAIWYERNHIPATVDIRNWRDLYRQLWAEYERMFPPAKEDKPAAGPFQE